MIRENAFSAGQTVKRSKRILVVDEDPQALELLKETLEQENYEVQTSSDGADILNQSTEDSLPDLIITDTVVPGMDEFQLVKTLKANEHTQHIKVVLCSVKASLADIKKGLAAGADQYIAKPFQPDDMVDRVNKLLRGQPLTEALKVESLSRKGGATKESWVDLRTGLADVGDDKRRHPRLEFHCPVRVEGLKGVQKITDMSEGGIFVENEQASMFMKGQTLHLNIKLPTEYESIKIKAEVANVRARGIGLKFVDLNQSHEQAIRVCFDAFKDTIPLR